MSDRKFRAFGQRFADLRVRPKMMVLHNLFFLALTVSVYFSLVPLVETRMRQAARREVTLILETFEKVGPMDSPRGIGQYDFATGTADALGMPPEARAWCSAHPGQTWHNEQTSEFIYKKDPDSSQCYRVRLPLDFYRNVARSAKFAVFGVLAAAYLLGVLLLEIIILPRYVYGPIDILLRADDASHRGDRQGEIIPEHLIPGDEIGQIMASRNITVRQLRRREDDLEHAKRTLEAQDRLVSLGMLSASVAHEMNTPLAVLHGSIEKMLETTTDESARQRLERMIRVSQRLKRISEGLLGFSRQRQQEFKVVALRPLVDEAWHLVGIDEKAGDISFSNEVPPESRVRGNADRLVQVFVNLLRNALAAVSRGGEVWVRCRPASIESGFAWAILVEDNGPGIPQEMIQQMFDAFVSTRLDARGTGLGLTVAEGIVNQHGGTLTASNRPQGGACLEIRLPVAHEENA